MEKYQAFFFDFDGVLVDSVEVKTKVFARLFESYGADIIDQVVEYHRHHGGMTRMDKFHYYYEHLLKKHLSEEVLVILCRQFEDLVVDEVVAAPEIPGAEVFLKACQGRIPCFVISATPEGELKNIIKRRGWSQYFEAICGAPRKKDENLRLVIRSHRLHPESCLFFGDAESDYRAATACGVPFLAILPGTDAPLLKAVPDVKWVPNFTDQLFITWMSVSVLNVNRMAEKNVPPVKRFGVPSE